MCVCIPGERGVEDLPAGADQLPEQVQAHPRLGRPLQQGQGAHQQRRRHEALSLLQGKLEFSFFFSLF